MRVSAVLKSVLIEFQTHVVRFGRGKAALSVFVFCSTSFEEVETLGLLQHSNVDV